MYCVRNSVHYHVITVITSLSDFIITHFRYSIAKMKSESTRAELFSELVYDISEIYSEFKYIARIVCSNNDVIVYSYQCFISC